MDIQLDYSLSKSSTTSDDGDTNSASKSDIEMTSTEDSTNDLKSAYVKQEIYESSDFAALSVDQEELYIKAEDLASFTNSDFMNDPLGRQPKRKREKARAKNFSSHEIVVLVKEIHQRRHFLFGPLKSPHYTQLNRDRAWDAVMRAVNAVASTERSVEEIRKKFKDLKSRTKQKAAALSKEVKKSGVDNRLTKIEEIILSFVGDDNVNGIKGGIDTLRPEVPTDIPEPPPPQPPPPQPPSILVLPILTDVQHNMGLTQPSTSALYGDAPHIQLSQYPQPSSSLYCNSAIYQNAQAATNTHQVCAVANVQTATTTTGTQTATSSTQVTSTNTDETAQVTTTNTLTKSDRRSTKEKALLALQQTNMDTQKQTRLLEEIKDLLAEEVELQRRRLELYENFEKEKLALKKQKLLLLQNQNR